MAKPKTSESHPLRIDSVPAARAPGAIGMTFCPGKRQADAISGRWERDLRTDVRTIAGTHPAAVVSLIEAHEFAELQVSGLGDEVRQYAVEWYHLPIRDGNVPDAAFERQWDEVAPRLRQHLFDGRSIVLHCKGGLGRTGMIAGRLLVEFGAAPDDAIQAVRQARPGTIETGAQEAYIRRQRPLFEPGGTVGTALRGAAAPRVPGRDI